MATDAATALAAFAKKKEDAKKARDEEQKALDAEQEKLIADAAKQHALLSKLLTENGHQVNTGSVPTGAATTSSFNGGAPRTGLAWPSLGSQTAVSAIVWPEPQTDPVTAALTDTIPDPNKRRYNNYLTNFENMQVPTCTVTVKTGVYTIKYSFGPLAVDAEDMWKRMGIRPNKT